VIERTRPRHAPTFQSVLARRVGRRAVLRAFGAAAALAATGRGANASVPRGVAAGRDERDHVADGHRADIVARWGDPILTGAPLFDPTKPSAAAQAGQFGYNCDFNAFMPLPRGSNRSDQGLLVTSHEYVNADLIWPGIVSLDDKARLFTPAHVAHEMAAHGLTVLEVRRGPDRWVRVAESPYNRRITATTPFDVRGPAAGHARLRTPEDPSGLRILGTINNCSGGVTPWHTVLSGEENIGYYFAGQTEDPRERVNHRRMEISRQTRNPWHVAVERFDVARVPHEPNRFGWVVELDPFDPTATPVKRTALGRFQHETATVALSPDGRVSVYSGDDRRFEYLYRYVSNGRFVPGDDRGNRRLLDEGVLEVARFEPDGTMRWLPLVHGMGGLTAANGFRSQADVLIETRRAADLMGATPMDRPEGVAVDPLTGRVYVAFSNNGRRTADRVDSANPRGPNPFGHIVTLTPPGAQGAADHAAPAYRWDMLVLAGDPNNPRHGARYPGTVDAGAHFACPDNLAVDPLGRLWVATDGQDAALGIADGLYVVTPAGSTHLFYRGPRGCEITGPALTPDASTIFISVQHPGEEEGSTVDKPSTRWPDFRDDWPPRPSVVAVTRIGGGVVGT
jgi:secreted PhoX family phosphatase